MSDPYRTPPECDHGISFDEEEAKRLCSENSTGSWEVRKRWPRLSGECPLGCGYNGIYYVSMAHYVFGDW